MTRWSLLLFALAVACEQAPTEAPAVADAPPAAAAAPAPAPAANDQAARVAELKQMYKEILEANDALDAEGAKAKLQEAQLKAEGDPQAAKAFQRLADEIGVVGAKVDDVQADAWYTRPAAADSKAELLVFWEVWCPHCKREVPELEKMQAEWGPKGLEVVGLTRLTRGATEADARAFIKEKGVTYAVGQLGDDTLADHLAISGVPAAALVKDGVVVWRGHPAALKDTTLAAALD